MRRWTLLAGLLLALLAGCEPVDPQAELERAAAEIAERLPLTIDERTTLIEARAETLEVVYVYEITPSAEEDRQEHLEGLQETATAHLTANKRALAFFSRHKIPLTYICRNEAGEELIRFSIAPWEL